MKVFMLIPVLLVIYFPCMADFTFDRSYLAPNAEEIVPELKELCNKGHLDIKTGEAYWWLMNYYRERGDTENQTKYENEGKKMILNFLSIPEEEGFPFSGSRMIYFMIGYYDRCAKWEEIIKLCDYALEKFYPSHPKSVERDSGKKYIMNVVHMIYRSRGKAFKNLGLLENAKRDFEKALKEFQGYMASDAPKINEEKDYVLRQERLRLPLAETLEALGEKDLAYEMYATTKANLAKFDAQFWDDEQKRFEAALERAGITSPTLELKSLHEEEKDKAIAIGQRIGTVYPEDPITEKIPSIIKNLQHEGRQHSEGGCGCGCGKGKEQSSGKASPIKDPCACGPARSSDYGATKNSTDH